MASGDRMGPSVVTTNSQQATYAIPDQVKKASRGVEREYCTVYVCIPSESMVIIIITVHMVTSSSQYIWLHHHHGTYGFIIIPTYTKGYLYELVAVKSFLPTHMATV